MNILITGGAGFIASHVVDTYIAAGHKVVVLDNLSTGKESNVNERATFHKGNVCDGEILRKLFDFYQFDAVNHHAAQMDVRRSIREPLFDAEVNILGSLRLIDAANRAGVKRFIYVSTGGAVYGEPICLPVIEDADINPACHYGISKHTPEHYLHLYQEFYGLDYVVLRYPNVYGLRQRPDGEAGVVAIFARRCLDGKECTVYGNASRDYVHVSDVARANLMALTAGTNEIINLGSEVATTTQEIYRLVMKAAKSNGHPILKPARPGEIATISLSGAKAKEMLGWQPEISLDDGIAAVIDSLR